MKNSKDIEPNLAQNRDNLSTHKRFLILINNINELTIILTGSPFNPSSPLSPLIPGGPGIPAGPDGPGGPGGPITFNYVND